jgi:hypothetical protein
MSSLEIQIKTYMKMIKSHPNWLFAGVFYDIESGLRRRYSGSFNDYKTFKGARDRMKERQGIINNSNTQEPPRRGRPPKEKPTDEETKQTNCFPFLMLPTML